MATVVCVGAAVLDMVLTVDALPSGGEKFRASDFTLVGGGGAANAAVTVARLGGRAMLAARIGDDAIGTMILDELRENDVDCSLVRRVAEARSSCSSICIDAEGERQIVNYRGAHLSEAAEWLRDSIPDCDAVLADTRWVAGAKVALQIATQRGVPGVLDAESPIEPSLEAITRASHVAFSAEGLRSFAGRDSLDEGLLAAAECHHGALAVTDGARGAYWIDESGVQHEPAVTVEAVDTLGAGDTWHGAYALALAEGHHGRQAVRFANVTAALKCQRAGGRKGIPSRAEVNAMIETMGD